MYVALGGTKGHESVTIREDYIPSGEKKKKTRIVKNLGPLRKLIADDPDFLEKLKAQVALETKLAKEQRTVTVTLYTKEVESTNDCCHKIITGHAIVLKLWKMMGLERFFQKELGDRRNSERLVESIFYLLSRRVSSPSSIRASNMAASNYAGIADASADVLYSVLECLDECSSPLIDHLDSFFSKAASRSFDHVCYDVTNFYFESTNAGSLLMFGYSKEHRSNEVLVVMGLLMDSNGIPIAFQLFSGDTMDQNTLSDAVVNLRERYGIGEITVVADRGMNSNGNLVFLSQEGHHFVISYTLKKSKADFKELCLSDEHPWQAERYDENTGELLYASKVLDTTCKARVLLSAEEMEELRIKRKAEGKRGRCPRYKTVEIPAKVHVTYSKKRRDKDLGDRMRALEKLQKRIDSGKVKASLRYGCNQYLEFDVDCKNAKIDEHKVMEAARFDGYYAVITDREDLGTEEAMRIYRDQWKIEESFRILKNDLEARPVFVWTDSRIRGHFALCYLALCMIRYLQTCMLMHGQEVMSAARIMNAINDSAVVLIGEDGNYTLAASVTEDYIKISSLLGMAPLQKYMTPVRFKALTGLDPRASIKRLVGEN